MNNENMNGSPMLRREKEIIQRFLPLAMERDKQSTLYNYEALLNSHILLRSPSHLDELAAERTIEKLKRMSFPAILHLAESVGYIPKEHDKKQAEQIKNKIVFVNGRTRLVFEKVATINTEGRDFVVVTQSDNDPTHLTFFEEIHSDNPQIKSSFYPVEDQALIDLLLMKLDEALKSR